MLPIRYNPEYQVEWEVQEESSDGASSIETQESTKELPQSLAVKPDWFCEAWIKNDLETESYKGNTNFVGWASAYPSTPNEENPAFSKVRTEVASTIHSQVTITQSWGTKQTLFHKPAERMKTSRSTYEPSIVGRTVTSFVTAFSKAPSRMSFVTAQSYTSTQRSSLLANKPPLTPWMKTLEQRGLLEPMETELNWSGKGQHVEFDRLEDIPLVSKSILGHSNTALVEAVRCRRIQLARKSISCSRQFTKEEALLEVEHLHKLRHAHIVQLVGTYMIGRTFAILMYPATKYNLDTFMERLMSEENDSALELRYTLAGFIRCLVNALDYVHRQHIKHYDIKPKNILVSEYYSEQAPSISNGKVVLVRSSVPEYRIYLADFGISHSFTAGQDMTDSPNLPRTLKYCAPESADMIRRGTSADIFSLGCVFIEMLTVCLGSAIDDFADFRGTSPTTPYHRSIEDSQSWSHILEYRYRQLYSPNKFLLVPCESIFELVREMLSEDPVARPSTEELVAYLGTSICCYKPPESYVIEPDLITNVISP